jgi:predicted TIM-barrel fold metal-dependent hydrolase
MTDSGQFRFVDSHVHLWDLANGWYPSLEPSADADQAAELGMGSLAAIQRTYLLDDLLSDMVAYDVREFVHVHATTVATAHVSETRWLAQLAARRGHLKRIVAQVNGSASPAAVRAELD